MTTSNLMLAPGYRQPASTRNNDEIVKRVAISIGPEYGTVASEQIKEAAKEAVKGLSYDLLIICGFAFDPSVSEESKRYGKLTVLPTFLTKSGKMSH